MDIMTKIVLCKLVTGEELVTLALVPLEDAVAEFEFLNDELTLLYPTVYAKSKFSNWLPDSVERSFPLNMDSIMVMTVPTDELANRYSAFIHDQGIDKDAIIAMTVPILEKMGLSVTHKPEPVEKRVLH